MEFNSGFKGLNKAYLPLIMKMNWQVCSSETGREMRNSPLPIQYYCVVSKWDCRNPGKLQTFFP